MKSLFISLLPLAVYSAVLIPRQAPYSNAPTLLESLLGPLIGLVGPLAGIIGGSGNVAENIVKVLPKAKLANVKTIAPQVRPTAKRVVASYGPYVLPGRGVCTFYATLSGRGTSNNLLVATKGEDL
jgi:hypothetical protein